MYKEHILKIFRYAMKNIWMLIFPLLRGFSVYHFNAADVKTWLEGAWMDILVLGAILVFGFVRWYFSRITIEDGCVIHDEGLLLRVRTTIPMSKISVTTIERPLWLMPVKAVRLSFDTRAGFFRSTDMKLLVNEEVCRALTKDMPDVKEDKRISGLPDPTALSVLLFSVFFSSSFSGAVYIATFFVKGGDIAHDILTMSLDKITETTEMITSRTLLKIPSAAVLAGAVFLAAWILSFVVNILRYSRFTIESDSKRVHISCGITNRRDYLINVSHINFVDIRQNLIMKVADALTIGINCAGYGCDSQHLPVIMPIRKKSEVGEGLRPLGVKGAFHRDFRPKRDGIWTYIWLPATGCFVVFPLQEWFNELFPKFEELSFFAAVMLEIPLVWMIMVKIYAIFTSGVTIEESQIIIHCSRWTTFHTVIAERGNIVKMELDQTIFQRFNRKCSLSVWLSGESVSKYTIQAMNLSDCLRIAEMLDYNIRRS